MYIYGPVPSRRLGLSLGVSPIPKKTCNYACVYCQLGKTDHMKNKRQMFFPVESIIDEAKKVFNSSAKFDIVTIVGEGEPTLYLGLGQLIRELKMLTNKPIAVITNGALLYDNGLQQELNNADIVLPTVDAYEDKLWQKINRPHKALDFLQIISGLEQFSHQYSGQLWLEIMLMQDINDDRGSLQRYKTMLQKIKYSKIYLNTPIRPPAKSGIRSVNHEKMYKAAEYLGGVSIDLLASQGFHSECKDDYQAILSIIKRHPMNQFEITEFLKTRGCKEIKAQINRLRHDHCVAVIYYKGYESYRLA